MHATAITVTPGNKSPTPLGEQLAEDVVQYPISWEDYATGLDGATPPSLSTVQTTISPDDGTAAVADDLPSGYVAPITVSALVAGTTYQLTQVATFANGKRDSVRLELAGVT